MNKTGLPVPSFASSSECVAKLKEIGMTDKGWVDDFNLHYEMENRSFERGQTFHNLSLIHI